MSLAVFQSIGPLELLIVLGIVLLIFGPKRLPVPRPPARRGHARVQGLDHRKTGDDDDEDDDDGRGSRREATAALGRPEDEPAAAAGVGRGRLRAALGAGGAAPDVDAPCGRSGTRIA